MADRVECKGRQNEELDVGIEDLFDDIRALPPGELAEVIDIVKYLRTRTDDYSRFDGLGASLIDEIMADPARRAALLESVQTGLEEHARGETLDMEEVFEELLSGLPE
jgi:predicted transcriptional regulator